MEKKFDVNCTRILRAVLNKSWKQHPTKQQLYGHLPPISKTIQVQRTKHAGHCLRSEDELISDVLRWSPSHRRASAERLGRTYLHQLCADTRCSLEDLPKAMDNRDEWREKVREIYASSIYIYIYIYREREREDKVSNKLIFQKIRAIFIPKISYWWHRPGSKRRPRDD